MGKSVIKSRIIKSHGFSLLEIIIALSIIGVVMVTLATYARKMIDEHVRQVDAEAIVQDIYGVLQFVNADTIDTFTNNTTVAEKVTNPLYQLSSNLVYPDAKKDPDPLHHFDLKGMENNPIWQSHPHNVDAKIDIDFTKEKISPWIARNYSAGVIHPVSNTHQIKGKNTDGSDKIYYSHSLKWSQSIWGTESVRQYFTDSGCTGTNVTGNSVYFKQQFLSCNENPSLKRSEIAIARIDLVNDKGSQNNSVKRVDVYVRFKPLDGNPARLEQFITPLTTAFRTRKIGPNINSAYLVMQTAGTNAWTLLNKTNGNATTSATKESDIAMLTDLPQMVGILKKGNTYGIRLTFDGNGDYLRTDGLNSAMKLCWNTKDGAAGPCLTAPSEKLLVLKSRTNSKEEADLQVGSVILTDYHIVNGQPTPDFNTAPRVKYAAFHNTNQIHPFFQREINGNPGRFEICTDISTPPDTRCNYVINDNIILEPVNGAIDVPLQTCPVAEGFTRRPLTNPDNPDDPVNHRLYPRLSAAISSVVSGLHNDGNVVNNVMPDNIFSDQGRNLNQLKGPNFTINRLGGTVLQIRRVNNSWRIAGMVASEDSLTTNRKAWIYINPSWLSVMITTWCSSEPQ